MRKHKAPLVILLALLSCAAFAQPQTAGPVWTNLYPTRSGAMWGHSITLSPAGNVVFAGSLFAGPAFNTESIWGALDGNGNTIATNDDWKSSQQAQIEGTGLAPSDSRESAILFQHFEPGPYTAIVRGKNNTVGVGLVEIYDVQQ